MAAKTRTKPLKTGKLVGSALKRARQAIYSRASLDARRIRESYEREPSLAKCALHVVNAVHHLDAILLGTPIKQPSLEKIRKTLLASVKEIVTSDIG